jgi:hypothetical protein
MNNLRESIGKTFLALCATLWVMIPTSPLVSPLVNRDSGAFLYTGWRILNGDVPYRDVWDHKPPVIFFINAAGLAVGNSRWGVWLIECAAVLAAALISLSVMKKLFGASSAVLATLLWLGTLVFVIQGGNYTTEYTLPLQFFALWLVRDIGEKDPSPWRWILLGLTGVVAFFTKQTAFGIWAAAFLYAAGGRIAGSKIRLLAKELAYFAMGAGASVAVVLFYFAANGALAQFWSAAFGFNFLYSTGATDLLSRVKPVLTGIGALTKPGLFQMAMFGSFLTVLFTLAKGTRDWKPHALLVIGLIDLPIEFLLLSASGRTYEHYYMAMLPVLALFAGFSFHIFFTGLSRWGVRPRTEAVAAAGAVAVMLWTSLGGYHYQLTTYQNRTYLPLIEFVRSNSDSGDSVLIWGNEPSINFFSLRESPTRFVYLTPIYAGGYADEDLIREFLDGIQNHPPKLIVDLHDSAAPFLELPFAAESMPAGLEFIRTHYEEVQSTSAWTIYQYTD